MTNKLLKTRRKGISLIEMIVVIGLLSIITLIISRFLVRGFLSYRVSKEGIESEERAAKVMRDFEFSVRAATTLATASADELDFYRFYDLNSPSPKKIRYFMDGTTFKVGITEPTGTPPNVIYPSTNEKIDYLIENVKDLSLSYFDDSGNALPMPVNLSSATMIGLSISIDQNPNSSPVPITQSTKVNLRNLKKNL